MDGDSVDPTELNRDKGICIISLVQFCFSLFDIYYHSYISIEKKMENQN